MKIGISVLAILASMAVSVILVGRLIIQETNQKFMTDYLKTTDGVRIAYNLYPVENPRGWLLLSHMMPATKESWRGFAGELQKEGYESIAIDLRGHGESGGGPNGYQKFSDAEHQASIQDLEAAWEFLQSRGATPEKTSVIGASIGANLSLQFLTLHPEVKTGILLSPGNYRGIDSGLFLKKFNPDQSLVLVASKKDDRVGGENAELNRQYYNLASQVKNRHLITFDNPGHGTDFFGLKEEYDLIKSIKLFLDTGKIIPVGSQ